jgi:hypothetical protein
MLHAFYHNKNVPLKEEINNRGAHKIIFFLYFRKTIGNRLKRYKVENIEGRHNKDLN